MSFRTTYQGTGRNTKRTWGWPAESAFDYQAVRFFGADCSVLAAEGNGPAVTTPGVSGQRTPRCDALFTG
ncbi:MAG: hypothetical protein U0941_18105 [Planctomycetaceae bacterium]